MEIERSISPSTQGTEGAGKVSKLTNKFSTTVNTPIMCTQKLQRIKSTPLSERSPSLIGRLYNRLRGNLSHLVRNYSKAAVFFKKAGIENAVAKMETKDDLEKGTKVFKTTPNDASVATPKDTPGLAFSEASGSATSGLSIPEGAKAYARDMLLKFNDDDLKNIANRESISRRSDVDVAVAKLLLSLPEEQRSSMRENICNDELKTENSDTKN